jgi:ADP-glucose pyrophosphorylase
MQSVRAALLAGGRGERLGRLTATDCKPLVPYAGVCRLVDFSVANVAGSGIPELVLLSQHGERRLIEHLLAAWGDRPGFRLNFGVNDAVVHEAVAAHGVLGCDTELLARSPERGTADALATNAEWVFADGARDLLLLHADHVYAFDYTEMLAQHRRTGADVTIGVQRIERRFVRLFGMVDVGPDQQVRRLVEKPQDPTSDLIFTAFCLFRLDALCAVLGRLTAQPESTWQHDVSRDMLPHMIAHGYRVGAYPVRPYWADIGTVERYHAGHLLLVREPDVLPLASVPRTLPLADVVYRVDERVIAGASVRAGKAYESVIYPGSRVADGALIERSVVLPGAVVGPHARLRDTVVPSGEVVDDARTGIAGIDSP